MKMGDRQWNGNWVDRMFIAIVLVNAETALDTPGTYR